MNVLDRLGRPECHRVRQILQSYLDGELDDSDAAMVAAHLEHCDRCGIEADLYEQVKESLGRLRQPPDPATIERLRCFAAEVPDRPPCHNSSNNPPPQTHEF